MGGQAGRRALADPFSERCINRIRVGLKMNANQKKLDALAEYL